MKADIVITIKKVLPAKEPSNEPRFEKWMRLFNAKDLAEMEHIAKGDKIMEELVEFVKNDLSHMETLED